MRKIESSENTVRATWLSSARRRIASERFLDNDARMLGQFRGTEALRLRSRKARAGWPNSALDVERCPIPFRAVGCGRVFDNPHSRM